MKDTKTYCNRKHKHFTVWQIFEADNVDWPKLLNLLKADTNTQIIKISPAGLLCCYVGQNTLDVKGGIHVWAIKWCWGETKSLPSHPVISGGDHQSVWQQDGSFGFLDVRDGHHWDGNLGRTNSRMNSQPSRDYFLHAVATEALILWEVVVTLSLKPHQSKKWNPVRWFSFTVWTEKAGKYYSL